MDNLDLLHHRRAFGHRGRGPQSGFTPTAIFDLPFSTLNPNSLVPDIATEIVSSVIPSTLGLTSTKVSTSTTSLPTSTTGISTTSTSTSLSTSTTSSTSSTSTSKTVPSTTSVTSVPHTKTTIVNQTISTTTHPHSTASSTAVASHGLSTGAVAGGVVVAIIAVIALIVLLIFFVRRSRRRDEDETDFDPQVFRRSAILISDPPTHEDTIARGFNPLPHTMIEKRLGSPAPTFGTQYGAPAPPAYDHHNEYLRGYSEKPAEFGYHTQHYAPGQIVNMNYNPSPMFTPAIHNQSPISPVHVPVFPITEQHHDQHDLARQPPMGANVDGTPSWDGATHPVLTRQPSAPSSSDGHSSHVSTGLASQKGDSTSTSDYVDLDRSSVSPYQAAQYVEISRRLNTEVPQGLQTQDNEKSLPPIPPQSRELSPFADPETLPASAGAQFAINRRNLVPSPRPKSGDTISSATSNTLDFPVPPSPAYTVSSRYRIDSTPPILPEINVDSRVATTRLSGLRNAITISDGLGSSDGSHVTNHNAPIVPSPLSSSSPKIAPIQDVEETSSSDTALAVHSSAPSPASPASPTAPTVPAETKKRTTVYSLYDPEDAYGGI